MLDGEASQIGQERGIVGRKLPWSCIQQAQGADAMTGRGDERRTGIKAQVRVAGDAREPVEPRILRQILDDEGLAGLDRDPADGFFSWPGSVEAAGRNVAELQVLVMRGDGDVLKSQGLGRQIYKPLEFFAGEGTTPPISLDFSQPRGLFGRVFRHGKALRQSVEWMMPKSH